MAEYTGPSDETLKFLAANLKGMADGVTTGKMKGKGTVVAKPQVLPTKLCPVCKGMHDTQSVIGLQKLEDGICGSCLDMLAQGYTACLHNEKVPGKDVWHHAFVKFKEKPEMAGQIVFVSWSQMQLLHKKHDENKDSNAETQNPG